MTAIATAPAIAQRASATPRRIRLISALPDLIASAFAGFAFPAIVLLLAGHFSPAWVLTLGLAGAALAVRVCGLPAVPVDRRTVICTLAAVGILFAWVAVGWSFTAQNLFAHRDPATYELAGRWLMDHSRMPIQVHPEVFGFPVGYDSASAGFGQAGPSSVYAQGNHLLPAMLAAAGWVFGPASVLKANVVFTAAGLLTVFGLGRRVVGPVPALLAMTALAVSMPMLFVSRDTYSEPLALLFVVGGLGLLQRAVESRRLRDFALAGFVLGMAAPVRIDSNVSMLAVEGAAAVLLVFAPPGRRRRVAGQVGALFAAAALPILLGWLDVTRLAFGYYRDERHHIVPIFEVGAVLLVLLPLVVLIGWHPSVRRRIAAPAFPQRAVAVAGVLIAATFAFLASRPLWMVAHGKYLSAVPEIQRRAGDAPDGTRTYTEHTVSWLAMYLGWPTVVLGVIGYFLLLRRAVRRRSLATVGMLAVGLTLTLLYLVSAQITPDQPWAMRRYVPVVIPLLLIAASYTLAALYRYRGWARTGWVRGVAAAGAVIMLAYPIVVTAPVAGIREEVPQLAQVRRLCAVVSPHGAVVLADRTAWSYMQTMRSYCGVPAIGLIGASPSMLTDVRQSAAEHGRQLYLIATNPAAITFAPLAAPSVPYSQVRTTRWPSTLHSPPSGPDYEQVAVYLATVRPDGFAEPVVRAGG